MVPQKRMERPGRFGPRPAHRRAPERGEDGRARRGSRAHFGPPGPPTARRHGHARRIQGDRAAGQREVTGGGRSAVAERTGTSKQSEDATGAATPLWFERRWGENGAKGPASKSGVAPRTHSGAFPGVWLALLLTHENGPAANGVGWRYPGLRGRLRGGRGRSGKPMISQYSTSAARSSNPRPSETGPGWPSPLRPQKPPSMATSRLA